MTAVLMMRYFGQRRPRGFHHNFIFVDERKDVLRSIAEGKAEECRRMGHFTEHGSSRRHGGGLALRIGVAALLALALVVLSLLALA